MLRRHVGMISRHSTVFQFSATVAPGDLLYCKSALSSRVAPLSTVLPITRQYCTVPLVLYSSSSFYAFNSVTQQWQLRSVPRICVGEHGAGLPQILQSLLTRDCWQRQHSTAQLIRHRFRNPTSRRGSALEKSLRGYKCSSPIAKADSLFSLLLRCTWNETS